MNFWFVVLICSGFAFLLGAKSGYTEGLQVVIRDLKVIPEDKEKGDV